MKKSKAAAPGGSAKAPARIPRTTTTAMRMRGVEVRINTTPVHVDGTESLELKVISDKKISLDARYAERYIDLPEFKGERKITEGHVQFLHDEMLAGNFNPTIVTIALAELNGVMFKLNGQHTCWAVWSLCQSKPEFALQGVRELKYLCDSEEQLRKMYGTFDRLLSRSDQHVTQIHLVDTPEFGDLAPSLIKKIIPGLTMWLFESRTERARYTPEQIATLARREHADTFRRVAKFWSGTNCHTDGHLMRQPTFAAMFATFDKDKKGDMATDFWSTVGSGVGLASRQEPRYVLREFLRTTAILTNEKRKRIVDGEEMYRICITAWNKWRAGELVKGSYKNTLERPKPR